MSFVLDSEERQALTTLLTHSPCNTYELACHMGYGFVPTMKGIGEPTYQKVLNILQALKWGGAAIHHYNRWEITEKGRIAAAIVAVRAGRGERVRAHG